MFNTLCTLVERHLPHHRKMVGHAKLFEIDPGREEDFTGEISEEAVPFLRDFFMLPFPVTALDLGTCCAILQDPADRVMGPAAQRRFLLAGIGESSDTYFITGGEIHRFSYEYDPATRKGIFPSMVFSVQQRIFFTSELRLMGTLSDRHATGVDQSIANLLATVLTNVALCNVPARWIVEETPLHILEKPPKSGAKLARSADRPKYTLLTPGKVRRLMQIADRPIESGDDRLNVQYRRAHTRLLQDERFKRSGLRGNRIFVKAVWRDKTEAVVGRKRYRVLLDR